MLSEKSYPRIAPITLFFTDVASLYVWIGTNIIILTATGVATPITTPTAVMKHSQTFISIGTASTLTNTLNFIFTKRTRNTIFTNTPKVQNSPHRKD